MDILERAVAVVVFGVFCCYVRVGWASPPGNQIVLCSIDSDSIQPGIKSAVPSEIRQGTIGLDERFLCHILRFMRIVHEASDQGEDLMLIFEYQQIESSLISLLHPCDQMLVRLFCHVAIPPLGLDGFNLWRWTREITKSSPLTQFLL